MIRRRTILSMIVLFSLLAVGCGSDRVAGNTTETENLLTAREFKVDSILPKWYHSDTGTVIATLRLDSSDVDFRHTDSIGRDLSVERGDSTPIPFQVVFWDRVAGLGRIQVRLDSSLRVPGAKIRLRWGFPFQRRSDSVAVWRSVPDSERVVLNSILIDDFEHGSDVSLLPSATSWYAFTTDSAQVSVPTLEPAQAGRSGTVAHISYQGNGWQMIGLQLGGHRNLRSLDSLVFWARGTGIVSPTLENLDSMNAGKAWKHIPLDSTTWTRIRIRPSDFDTADNQAGNVGWNPIRYRVTTLTFFVSTGRDLYLDDIRMYGVNQDDFK